MLLIVAVVADEGCRMTPKSAASFFVNFYVTAEKRGFGRIFRPKPLNFYEKIFVLLVKNVTETVE